MLEVVDDVVVATFVPVAAGVVELPAGKGTEVTVVEGVGTGVTTGVVVVEVGVVEVEVEVDEVEVEDVEVEDVEELEVEEAD